MNKSYAATSVNRKLK